MRDKFRGTHYLAMKDFTAEEIRYLVDLAADLKRKWTMREPHEYLRGKTYGMIFEKKIYPYPQLVSCCGNCIRRSVCVSTP